jgi:hypothetical protein
MRRILLLLAVILLLCVRVAAQEQGREEITVIGEGMAALQDDPGAAEEEAVWEAKRNAVEQAVGVFLRARSIGRDLELLEDEIQSQTEGFVRQWEIVPGSRIEEATGVGRILRLKVRATVALLPIIRRLADIADVYDDMERPRVRVEIEGDAPSRCVQNGLLAALKAQQFDLAESGPAEIVLQGHLETVPTVRFGDPNSPFGVGEAIAACHARLTARFVSTASEEVLLAVQSEGDGQSFQSDAEALANAGEEAAHNLFAENAALLTRNLLVRWARERQEGHVVAVQTTGLKAPDRALLREQVCAMRGFRKIVSETGDKTHYTLRFLTRQDTRVVRRRLSALRLDQITLTVENQRGPLILCVAGIPPRISRR